MRYESADEETYQSIFKIYIYQNDSVHESFFTDWCS